MVINTEVKKSRLTFLIKSPVQRSVLRFIEGKKTTLFHPRCHIRSKSTTCVQDDFKSEVEEETPHFERANQNSTSQRRMMSSIVKPSLGVIALVLWFGMRLLIRSVICLISEDDAILVSTGPGVSTLRSCGTSGGVCVRRCVLRLLL